MIKKISGKLRGKSIGRLLKFALYFSQGNFKKKFQQKVQNFPPRFRQLSEKILVPWRNFYSGVVKTWIFVMMGIFQWNFLLKKIVYFLYSISDFRCLVKNFQLDCQSCFLCLHMNFSMEIFNFYVKKNKLFSFFGTLSSSGFFSKNVQRGCQKFLLFVYGIILRKKCFSFWRKLDFPYFFLEIEQNLSGVKSKNMWLRRQNSILGF